MKKYLINFFLFLILFFFFLFFPEAFLRSVLAVKFSLIAPEGKLVRGQTVRFTINIDTQGATVKTAQVGMTYETESLEYVSVSPGNTMTSVTASQLGGGKILFSGENSSGFSGQGVFAYVDFTIIAESPGSTQLCVLWVPTTSPTTAPTNPPQPTTAPQSTSAPPPTALPTSGQTHKTTINSYLGLSLLISFAILNLLDKKIFFKKTQKK